MSILEKIEAGKFSKKELENLYNNAVEKGYPEIAEAAKAQLKGLDKRAYSARHLKPIRERAQSILEGIVNEQGWGSWEHNRVRNGIKVGGGIVSGEWVADYYVSAKLGNMKSALHFCVLQRTEDSGIEYLVFDQDDRKNFYSDSEQAIVKFNELMKKWS